MSPTSTSAKDRDERDNEDEDHQPQDDGNNKKGSDDDDNQVRGGDADNGGDAASEKKRRRRKRKRKRKSADNDEDDDTNKANQQDDGNVEENSAPLLSSMDQQRAAECDRTVFVEGIPYNATEQDVRDFFQEHGNLTDITDCRLPVWQDSGRLRGYGHVVFASVASQQEAIANLSRKYMKNTNRFLNIQAAKRPRDVQQQQSGEPGEPSKTIMLNNLSYDASEDDIQSVLEQYGTIAKGGVRVVRNSVNQRSKGFAYVEFENISSATKVMKNSSASGIVILDRPCRVDYDHGRIRGSFRTASGRLWQKEYGKPSMYGKRQRQQQQQRRSQPSRGHHESSADNDY